MREIDVKMISDNVAEMCIEANYYLSEDMKSCLNKVQMQCLHLHQYYWN